MTLPIARTMSSLFEHLFPALMINHLDVLARKQTLEALTVERTSLWSLKCVTAVAKQHQQPPTFDVSVTLFMSCARAQCGLSCHA